MAGTSVQFVGVGEVMKAYDNKDCVNWSVCQGKALNFSYSGNDKEESRVELETWLKMIGKRPNQAIYTLKFYEDFGKGKITAATAEHCSFNFRINDPDDGYEIGRSPYSIGTRGGVVEELLMEIRETRKDVMLLQEKVNKPAQLGNVEEPLETWEKILDHPITMGLIGKIFNIDPGLMSGEGKIAGIPGDGNINDVIQELWSYDPKLDEHLYKLLQLAKSGKLKPLLSILDGM